MRISSGPERFLPVSCVRTGLAHLVRLVVDRELVRTRCDALLSERVPERASVRDPALSARLGARVPDRLRWVRARAGDALPGVVQERGVGWAVRRAHVFVCGRVERLCSCLAGGHAVLLIGFQSVAVRAGWRIQADLFAGALELDSVALEAGDAGDVIIVQDCALLALAAVVDDLLVRSALEEALRAVHAHDHQSFSTDIYEIDPSFARRRCARSVTHFKTGRARALFAIRVFAIRSLELELATLFDADLTGNRFQSASGRTIICTI